MSEIEKEFLPIFCENKNTIDVGTNKGDYLYSMSENSNFVYGFEPVSKIYSELIKKRNFPVNAELYPYAVSDFNGEKEISIPIFKNRFNKFYNLFAMSTFENSLIDYFERKAKGYSGLERELVECRTLDSFEFDNISFLKVDVEGHEYEVLKGASNLLESNKPSILVEIEERHKSGNHERVNNYLKELGYIGYFIKDNQVFDFREFDVDSMQIDPLNKIDNRITPNINGYVNNFLFFHESNNLISKVEKNMSKK